ncbi:MAG: hypothetical protein Kow0058_11960 [Roseovarius sp.]
MTIRTVLLSLAIAAASVSQAAAGCAFHDKQAMSCAEGSVYDPQSGSCVPAQSS